MTDSISLLELDAGDSTRRDRWGRYLVTSPHTSSLVSYSRATTIAKVLDAGGGLADWKAAMTACGMVMRRGLFAQWEALLAEFSDPWYASAEGKARCKALVEDCAAVGGANDRAQIGTALHAITALIDAGNPPPHLTSETQQDVEAYQNGLVDKAVSINSEWIELTVVLDAYEVAGTFDRLVHVPSYPLPLVADLKTGASLDYSWQSFAVQLAIYSRANAIYRQGKARDGSEDERIDFPAVDQHTGLILWLPAGTGRFEVHEVDLDAGWEAFEHSMWTRSWRSRSVASPLHERGPDDHLEALLEASLDPGGLSGWLQWRIDAIGAHVDAKKDLISRWPADLPSPRSGTADRAQLADIEKLCDVVERQWGLSFPPPRPR